MIGIARIPLRTREVFIQDLAAEPDPLAAPGPIQEKTPHQRGRGACRSSPSLVRLVEVARRNSGRLATLDTRLPVHSLGTNFVELIKT